VEEAIEVARTLQSKGFDLTLDYLGESVRTHQEADAAAREYVHLIDVLMASGIERNISLKLTQLGAGVDRATCIDNLRRIPRGRRTPRLLRAHRHGELGVHRPDARHLRDAVEPRAPQPGRRHPGGVEAQ
jgi:hypothetical protein